MRVVRDRAVKVLDRVGGAPRAVQRAGDTQRLHGERLLWPFLQTGRSARRLRVSCEPIDYSADRSAPMTPVSTPSARGAGAAMIALGVLMAMAGRASIASPEVLRSMVEPSFKPLAYAAVS